MTGVSLTAEPTPASALALLRQGNQAFLDDVPQRQSRLSVARGQKPFAAYVTCSDSRVSPELLFGRGLGELFIIRNAGNTLDVTALGSLEFAVGILKVPLIVVMGHEACGAVEAATSVVRENRHFPGALGKMIQPIVPAVLDSVASGAGFDASVRFNVRRVVRELRKEASPLLLEPQARGELQVVGAYYSLTSGEVDFFDLSG